MPSLKDKIENALNESRTLVLGVEVLLGFEYEAYFQSSFDRLPPMVQALRVVSLEIMLAALALLMLPAAYHRIVAQGNDTHNLNEFTSRATGLALFPFSVGLALDVYAAAGVVVNDRNAIFIAAAMLAVSLFFWYGLELIARKRDPAEGREPGARSGPRHRIRALVSNKEKEMAETQRTEGQSATPLNVKIKQVLTETRIVLPGAQALLGFQLTIVLTQKFDRIGAFQQQIHLLSLLSIAVCTVLLMAPAAYHRIVEDGEDTERFHHFASAMVLAALIFLALGLAGDLEVVVYGILKSAPLAWGSAGLALLFFYGLWFGFTALKRSQAMGE